MPKNPATAQITVPTAIPSTVRNAAARDWVTATRTVTRKSGPGDRWATNQMTEMADSTDAVWARSRVMAGP